MLIEIEKINSEITIEQKKYVLIEIAQLEKLLNNHEEHQNEIKDLQEVIVGVMCVLGLWNPIKGEMHESIRTGKGIMKPIIKSLGKLTLDVTAAQFSSQAAEDLAEQFIFLTKIFPIIEKYSIRKKESLMLTA
jgi:hypothetical protein